MPVRHDILESTKIVETIALLCQRIEDRFPDAGLLKVGRTLHDIATETDLTIVWIERPNHAVRLFSGATILLMLAVLVGVASQLEVATQFTAMNVITLAEAVTNELILIGAAVAFLVTMEVRQKRKRVIAAVGQLRSIAHVIDSHQLTKDPTAVSPTEHSPQRKLSDDQLARYLNYCSEMLSLTSKVAFLYIQNFPDSDAERAVHDLEMLTIGLSSKVWSKILLIQPRA